MECDRLTRDNRRLPAWQKGEAMTVHAKAFVAAIETRMLPLCL